MGRKYERGTRRVLVAMAGASDSTRLFQDIDFASWDRDPCPIEYGPVEQLHAWRTARNEMIRDVAFVRCKNLGGGLSTYGAPVHRSMMRNVSITDCSVHSYFGHGAVFEEVTIDRLRTSRCPVILDACVFRHVTLKGNCGSFLLNADIEYDHPSRSAAFRVANHSFFESVDWALDISDVRATCLELRGCIPAKLVRRDPGDQVVMTREVALEGRWRDFEPPPHFSTGVWAFLQDCEADNVFCAYRKSKDYKDEVSYFNRLRSHGLVT